ncbi:MAG: thiE2 [Bacteroidetes bacterium]|jgi:thiamine-phosphate pyrophosphorylase|nr:thiE2 [Bacteroidota bacterium]
MLHRLQYISQGKTPAEHINNIYTLLDSGVKLVQLRLKNVEKNIYLESAASVKELCVRYDANLIINDEPQIAKSIGADAVHLGLNDMKIEDARKIAPGMIVGGTANTFEQVKQRCSENVDYIGLGPFRFTATKEKLSPVIGAEGYTSILSKMQEEKLTAPVYAIGGIEKEDLETIMETGVYGIAVSGMLTRASNKEQLIKEITKILYNA